MRIIINPLAFGPVAIQCEHGFDVCPKCDLMVVGMCGKCVCLFYDQKLGNFGFCKCSHAAGNHQPKHELRTTFENCQHVNCTLVDSRWKWDGRIQCDDCNKIVQSYVGFARYRHCAHCFDGSSPMICGFPNDRYGQISHVEKCRSPKCVIGTRPS